MKILLFQTSKCLHWSVGILTILYQVCHRSQFLSYESEVNLSFKAVLSLPCEDDEFPSPPMFVPTFLRGFFSCHADSGPIFCPESSYGFWGAW